MHTIYEYTVIYTNSIMYVFDVEETTGKTARISRQDLVADHKLPAEDGLFTIQYMQRLMERKAAENARRCVGISKKNSHFFINLNSAVMVGIQETEKSVRVDGRKERNIHSV